MPVHNFRKVNMILPWLCKTQLWVFSRLQKNEKYLEETHVPPGLSKSAFFEHWRCRIYLFIYPYRKNKCILHVITHEKIFDPCRSHVGKRKKICEMCKKTCDHLCFAHISHVNLKHFYGNKQWTPWTFTFWSPWDLM